MHFWLFKVISGHFRLLQTSHNNKPYKVTVNKINTVFSCLWSTCKLSAVWLHNHSRYVFTENLHRKKCSQSHNKIKQSLYMWNMYVRLVYMFRVSNFYLENVFKWNLVPKFPCNLYMTITLPSELLNKWGAFTVDFLREVNTQWANFTRQ